MLLANSSQIGQIPKAHKLLFGNPLLPKIFPNIEKTNEVQNVGTCLLRLTAETSLSSPHCAVRIEID